MCDYSLHHLASRPAKVGEPLVTTKFEHTSTQGFVAPSDPSTPVCVLPGTELAFAKDVTSLSTRQADGTFKGVPRKIGGQPQGRTATFVQVNEGNPYTHHDALLFPNGVLVLLTDLVLGQEAHVLTLPADPATLTGEARKAAEAEQSRAAVV